VVLKKEGKGEARVMSYKDLKEARAKRVTKEKAEKGTRKRGRPPKKSATKIGAPATQAESEPWRAPVARMVAEDHGTEDLAAYIV
jgi:hypothetical protein